MTANLPPESKSPSRRAVLAAALGGAAAMVARTAIQPSPARAAGDDGSPINVGSTFLDVQTGTYLSAAATDVTVLAAVSSAAGGHGAGIGVLGVSGSGNGVRGTSDSGTAVRGISGDYLGVHGSSPTATGVYGSSTSGTGVVAESESGRGLYASSSSTFQAAATGRSSGNSTGVMGGSGSTPIAKAKTGVFGHADQDSTSKGVWGETTSGAGLYGVATSGYAIRGSGRVKLGKVSGVATITAGNTSKTVTPGVNVTSGSFVLITARANIGTRALWFTTDAANDRFTIHMSSSRSSGTKVAWLLLG